MGREGEQEILAQLVALQQSLARIQQEIGQLTSELDHVKGEVESRLQAPVATAEPPIVSGVELGFVNNAFQQLALGKTQEEILENYLREASTQVARAILFLRKEAQYVPWKSIGFPFQSIEAVSAGDPQDAIVRAAEQKRIIYRADTVDQAFPWLREAGPLPRFCICIPVVFEDFSPLVFYGDSTQPIALDSLELLSHLASLVLKNHYLQTLLGSGVEVAAEAAPIAAAEAPPAPAAPDFEPVPPAAPAVRRAETPPQIPVAEPAPPSEASEPAEETEEVEEEPTFAALPDEKLETDLDFDKEISSAQEEEFEMAEAGVQEELGAFQWEPPAPRPEAVVAQEAAVSSPTQAEPVPTPPTPTLTEEEEKYHTEARRFARLLVSEIKLYNEEEVFNGRQHKDLYSRLKLDVDRSREMYEKRVNPLVATSLDYFHEEVVRLLAKGDESTLGPDYPGPLIRPAGY